MSGSSSTAMLLGGLAVAVSVGHLAWSLQSSPPQPAPRVGAEEPERQGAETECRCDDLELRRELAAVRDELAVLRAEGASGMRGKDSELAARRPPARVEPSEHELAIALHGDRPLPKINVFMDIPEGVRLSQRDDGRLDIEAIDPSTSGEQFLVYVITEDGDTKPLEFTVP